MYRCAECGNTERFQARQTVEELVELDRHGEFVRVINADTKDRYDLECYACDSSWVTEVRSVGQ